jgi:hypothetical protein
MEEFFVFAVNRERGKKHLESENASNPIGRQSDIKNYATKVGGKDFIGGPGV